MTPYPPGGGDSGDSGDGAAVEDEGAARRRHPSAHPWRTDHAALAQRLAAHFEAEGWDGAAARAAAEQARASAVRR